MGEIYKERLVVDKSKVKNSVARSIVLLLEGIRVSSEVMDVTEKSIDEQFNYIKS